jgi:hypothetical protein
VTSPPARCYLDCLIISSNGPGDLSSLPLLPGLFLHHFLPPNLLAGRHTKVAIHYVSLSLSLSPLRQQPCLKAQTTKQWPSHVQEGCITQIAMYIGSSASSIVGIVISSPNGGRASNWLYYSSSTTSSTATFFLFWSWIRILYIEDLCDIFGKNKWLFSVTKKSKIDISHTILVSLHSIWESDPLVTQQRDLQIFSILQLPNLLYELIVGDEIMHMFAASVSTLKCPHSFHLS